MEYLTESFQTGLIIHSFYTLFNDIFTEVRSRPVLFLKLFLYLYIFVRVETDWIVPDALPLW